MKLSGRSRRMLIKARTGRTRPHRKKPGDARVDYPKTLLMIHKILEMFGNRLSHRLLVLAAASMFVDRVSPEHLAGACLNQLNRNISPVLYSSAVGEQAACNFSAR